MFSPNQTYYFAWDLSHPRSTSDSTRVAGVLSEAKVDLNPHQIDAALFAFQSPLSKGAILADEVGLGKTIEAGIILSQFWAERKRHILIVVPASLRTQWNIELMEKFYLPSKILEKNSYDGFIQGGINPFDDKQNIIICSFQFFVNHEKEISLVPWDLAVIDEAHKLRNVYKRDNIIGNSIKKTLSSVKKVLLTATPLQNNLKELYGLISIIDDDYFTSANIFSERYNAITTRQGDRFGELRHRLTRVIHRTLRSQVREYVNYTKRSALTQEYKPSDKENELYKKFNDYLQRKGTFGIPDKQKPLLSLLLRKILGSSAYALSFTLQKMIDRLMAAKKTGILTTSIDFLLSEEDLPVDEYNSDAPKQLTVSSSHLLVLEIEELKYYKKLALSIHEESKATVMLKALQIGFSQMEKLGANKKALIFTESRRTQEYLYDFLRKHGYDGKVVCFNGTNNSAEIKQIYDEWRKKYKDTSRSSGNAIIDKKQAIVDFFNNKAEIMIATEAGAEGINLQFCSMVVNYDMPWNPQRIEQRIGRCHRYGQKYDVVVINFVNTLNQAEERAYELLSEKFNLFDGVFGSSDEILGALEQNIDLERRLNKIYQTCRTEEEINKAFDVLQKELDEIINERISQTKKFLVENFDEDVLSKLKISKDTGISMVNCYNRHLWNLATTVLKPYISNVNQENYTFKISGINNKAFPNGLYTINKNIESAHLIRLSDKTGQFLVKEALNNDLPELKVHFSLNKYPRIISILNQHRNESGYLSAYLVSSNNQKDSVERIIFCSMNKDGVFLDAEFGESLMEIPTTSYNPINISEHHKKELIENFSIRYKEYQNNQKRVNNDYVNMELDKLDDWCDERTTSLENEILSIEKEIKELNKQKRQELDANKKIELSSFISERKKIKNKKIVALFAAQDENEEIKEKKREEFLSLLKTTNSYRLLFMMKWILT